MYNLIYPVILCGGNGTRLWPLSRGLYPKQFMNLGDGHTLFQDTLNRLQAFNDLQLPVIICNEAHRFYVLDELQRSGMNGQIILEPTPKNTAPAIALAAASVNSQDALLLIMPADHAIGDSHKFAQSVHMAMPFAQQGYIVTFGVTPTGPETGYGYIKPGKQIGEDTFLVDQFVEKPDLDQAKLLLSEDNPFWNSGIFLLRADIYLNELQKFAPAIAEKIHEAWAERKTDKNITIPGPAFIQCPAISIDYAIMEHTDKAVVSGLQTSWGDLGAWESFYQAEPKDQEGNVRNGDIIVHGAKNCYIRSSGRLIAALDVENLAIVETKDAVLVAPRASLQRVKDVVEKLKGAGRPECKLHKRVFRPWGSYESLSTGDRFQVKRITVNPGASLSLQMHYHRAEHWVVVSGTAEITNGDKVGIFIDNQSTYIPAGTKHRLHNPGKKPLVIIETQSGSYLGEDDIVRFSDNYGRASSQAGISDKKKSKEKEVVILSSADWDNPCWTNKQHMAVQFAEHGWRVLYVDSLGLRQPAMCKKDFARMGKRLLKAVPKPREVRPGIWVASPLVVPLHHNALIRNFNDSALLATLKLHMRILGMKNPLLWTYNPLLASLCKKLPHSGIVYHCVDDLSAAPRVNAMSILQGERELGEVADLCFTTSPALQQKMEAFFPKAFYEPNVCEYDHFRAATARELPEPAELAGIPHPRLLFVGAISDYKIDFDLLEKIAVRMPHIHWVLVGTEGEGQPDSRKLKDLSNIHLLGTRPYSELPAFMRHCDAAVLPATRNAYTEAMFPMKFFEYLAGGLQVISTPLPALKDFETLYFPANNADEFCEAITRVINGERKDACSIDSACRYHSWSERFGRMNDILEKTIG